MRYLFSIFKRKKKAETDVVPSCSVCEHAQDIKDEGNMLCAKCGVVSKDYKCRKFHYDPIKRVPQKRQYGINEIHDLVEECVVAEGREVCQPPNEETETEEETQQ